MINLTPHNIVLDIETLSTNPNANVLSIGAVAVDMDTYELIDSFYVNLDRTLGREVYKRVEDDRTVEWWMKQDARVFAAAVANPIDPPTGLQAFRDWCKSVKGKSGAISMWGNGAAFDNVILKSYFDACEIAAPWHYRYDRCFRTLKALFPDVESRVHVQDSATKHHALEDAAHEAKYLMAIVKYFKEKKGM